MITVRKAILWTVTVFLLITSLGSAQATGEERVERLISQMTLEEKMGQMVQINVTRLMGNDEWDRGALNPFWIKQLFADLKVGSILSGGGSSPLPNNPQAWVKLTNEIQRQALSYSRLKIPIIYGTDAVHGHNNVVGATIFPHNIGLANSWHPELVEAVARATAEDVYGTGIIWNFSPVADLGLDIRWGRFYETFGEDPFLASRFNEAAVTGTQEFVAATGKHFLGYSLPEGGQDRANADISWRSLWEIHLPAFQAQIAAGVKTIMINSGSVNGVPVHASPFLLTTLLRDELGFTGLVVSDWEDIYKLHSVHRIAPTYKQAIAASVNAGVDMAMVPLDAAGFIANLKDAVREGLITEERLDQAVRRVLTLKFELGLFDAPLVDEQLAGGMERRHEQLAHQAALESITLLKNTGNILPIGEDVRRILVTGPGANDVSWQMGGWTIGWQGVESYREMPPAVTIIEGIEQHDAPQEISYASTLSDAVMKAEDADLVVVVIGEGPYAEGEGDRINPTLPSDQVKLVKQLKALGKDVVGVMIAGRPLIISEIIEELDAFVMAYLPGTSGGTAVADVLFGAYNPSGRLATSWLESVGQIPLTHNHWRSTSFKPLYPFGFGLSYTSFDINIADAPVQVLNGDVVAITISLQNTGDVTGSEVIQVYVEPEFSPVLARAQQLVAFQKVSVAPGEEKLVTLEFSTEQLAMLIGDVFGPAERKIVPGLYWVRVGSDSVPLEIF